MKSCSIGNSNHIKLREYDSNKIKGMEYSQGKIANGFKLTRLIPSHVI